MFTMACSGRTDNIFYRINRPYTQKKEAWYKLEPSRSCYLSSACLIHDELNILHIQQSDKIIILLRFNNVYTVYRKKDGAVAILKDVSFTPPNPPMTMEISPQSGIVHGIEITLMYAEALRDWTHTPDIEFHRGDTVLILADIKQEEYVGLTGKTQVGVFPSAIVKIITKPRRLLMGDVTLRMKNKNFTDDAKFPLDSTNATINTEYMTLLNTAAPSIYESLNKPPSLLPRASTATVKRNRFQYQTYSENDPPSFPPRGSTATVGRNRFHSQTDSQVSSPNLSSDYLVYDTSNVQVSSPYLSSDYLVYDTSNVQNIRPPPPKSRLPTKPPQLSSNYQNDRTSMQRFHLLRKTLEMMPSDLSEDAEVTSNLTADVTSQLLYDGTPDEEASILQFGKSEGFPFQGNKPIRLGGATQEEDEIYGDYATMSAETKLLWKRNQFKPSEIPVSDEDGYCQGDQMKDMNDLEYIQHLIVKREGNEDTLKYLTEKGDMVVSKALQADVAEHLIEEKWDEFGKLLKVAPIPRLRIQKEFSDISQRTTALLDAWQKKRGNEATVKELLRALLKLEMEEISSLLEDLRDTLKLEDSA